MRHSFLAVSLFAITPVTPLAQADPVLDATRVSRFIVLEPGKDGKSVTFATDTDATTRVMLPLTDGHLFAARSNRGMNVMIGYVNPLRFTWGISAKQAADPLVASVEKLLSEAGTLFAQLGGPTTPTTTAGAPTAISAEVRSAIESMNIRPGTDPTVTGESLEFIDPSLLEWHMWTQLGAECLKPHKAAIAGASESALGLDKLLNSAAASSTEGEVNSATDFRNVVRTALKGVHDAEGMDPLRQATDKLTKALEQLAAANNRARKGLSSLQGSGKVIGGLKVDDDETMCAALPPYSQRVFESYAVRAGSTVDARERLVVELRAVEKAIRDALRTTKPGEGEFFVGHIDVAQGRRTSVTVTIRERDIQFNGEGVVTKDKSQLTSTFEVMEYQSFVTDFAQGMAFTSVAFPLFKTNVVNDVHVVASAGDSRPRALAIAMLNVIPNSGWSGFTRFVGQIGVGASTEAPLLLAGAGIRFTQPQKFVLTFGAAFPFVQRLKSLAPDQPVEGEAALKKDLERVIGKKPALYIGVQR